jgi:lysylphosphatidylglycerol synthetase-like protein (DUF2156 family)
MDDRPACARCAYETATRPQRRFALAVFFLTFAGGMGFWATRRYDLWPHHAALLGFGGAVALVVAAFIAASARSAGQKDVVRREAPEDEAPFEGAMDGNANPYRAGARRVMLAVSPGVSGKVTALVVVLSFVSAAVLVPASVHLPRWIEAEMVLAFWWVVLAVTFIVLLYRGFRLKDDLVYFAPWDRPATSGKDANGEKEGKSSSSRGSVGDGCSGFVPDGCGNLDIDGEAVVVVIVVVVALVLALGAAWLMVEIALPLAFFAMYSVLMRAIRRAASDRRGCAGDFMKSLGSGLLWASIYVLPIAALTWVVHDVNR